MNITIQGKVIDCYEKPIYVNKETGQKVLKEGVEMIKEEVKSTIITNI